MDLCHGTVSRHLLGIYRSLNIVSKSDCISELSKRLPSLNLGLRLATTKRRNNSKADIFNQTQSRHRNVHLPHAPYRACDLVAARLRRRQFRA
jgi:hypothetical protein